MAEEKNGIETSVSKEIKSELIYSKLPSIEYFIPGKSSIQRDWIKENFREQLEPLVAPLELLNFPLELTQIDAMVPNSQLNNTISCFFKRTRKFPSKEPNVAVFNTSKNGLVGIGIYPQIGETEQIGYRLHFEIEEKDFNNTLGMLSYLFYNMRKEENIKNTDFYENVDCKNKSYTYGIVYGKFRHEIIVKIINPAETLLKTQQNRQRREIINIRGRKTYWREKEGLQIENFHQNLVIDEIDYENSLKIQENSEPVLAINNSNPLNEEINKKEIVIQQELPMESTEIDYKEKTTTFIETAALLLDITGMRIEYNNQELYCSNNFTSENDSNTVSAGDFKIVFTGDESKIAMKLFAGLLQAKDIYSFSLASLEATSYSNTHVKFPKYYENSQHLVAIDDHQLNTLGKWYKFITKKGTSVQCRKIERENKGGKGLKTWKIIAPRSEIDGIKYIILKTAELTNWDCSQISNDNLVIKATNAKDYVHTINIDTIH